MSFIKRLTHSADGADFDLTVEEITPDEPTPDTRPLRVRYSEIVERNIEQLNMRKSEVIADQQRREAEYQTEMRKIAEQLDDIEVTLRALTAADDHFKDTLALEGKTDAPTDV